MSIRNQILLPIILVVLLIVGSAIGVSVKQFSDYVNEAMSIDTERSLKGLAGEIEAKKQESLIKAKVLAEYPGVAAAVAANDTAATLALLSPLVKNLAVDFLTVTNAEGKVVARTHEPGKFGDSVTNQANVVAALKGAPGTFIEPGTVVKLSARSGVPIRNASGVIVGVISAGYQLDSLAIIDHVKQLFGADFTIFLGDVRISTTIVQDGKRVIGTKLDPAITKIVLGEGKPYLGAASILGQPYRTAYMPLVGPDQKNIGVLFAGQSAAKMEAAIARTRWIIGGMGAGLLVLGLFVMFFVVRRITVPLGLAVEDLAQLGAGNFTATVPPELLRRKDEIGKLSSAVDALTQNMRGLLRKIAQSAEQVAASSEQLTASAQQSAEAANNVAESIQQVALGSEKQVGAVNDTSAIVEEISATMQEVAATAGEMATLAEQTAKAAQKGKASIDVAVTQMDAVNNGSRQAQLAAEELKGSSAQIGEIVNLISSIAGQTNLLALNAAIEAARAGEQGRGFAVVAEEVRKLAEQSEAAAKQIKDLVTKNHGSIGNVVGAIDNAIRDISQGVELVNVAGGNFAAINAQIAQVTDQVEVIARSVHQAATGSQRIVVSIRAVENLSRDAAAEAENVSAATEEQSASMQEIAASSQALAKLAEELKVAVARFRV